MTTPAERMAFVLGALTGEELTAGKRDVTRVYSLLTDPTLGGCSNNRSKPIPECRSKSKFQRALDKILRNWRGANQLVFYFTGHGKVVNGEYCLQVGASEDHLLPFNSLLSELKVKGVGRAILILDTCYSGAATGGKSSENPHSLNADDLPQRDLPTGIAILASSRATELSWELEDGSASLFTRLLCEGIEKGLDGRKTTDGYINVEDLVNFINEKLETDQYASFPQRSIFGIHGADRAIWISKNPSGRTSREKGQSDLPVVHSIEDLRYLAEITPSDQHPCPDASIADLDWELVEKYLEGYPHILRKQPQQDILTALGLLSPIPHLGKRVPHKSAVLCFARRPELFYPQAKARFVVGNLKEKEFIRNDVTGPLSHQVIRLYEHVEEHLRLLSRIVGPRRQERPEIDLHLVRELISNAIMHRDYEHSGVVTIALTDTALEIKSPGVFRSDTSWNELIESDGDISRPINLNISNYLSYLSVYDGLGKGFAVVRDYLKENGEGSITCKELPGSITLIRVLRPSLGNHWEVTSRSRPPYDPPTPPPDPQTLPPHAPLPPNSYLPHQRNPLFTGRHPQLLQLAKALLHDHNDILVTQTVAASGLGGIGKTQLAVEFAYRYGQFFEGGVYWLNCDNAANIPAEIALIGGQKGMGLYQEAERLTVEEQVGRVQQAWLEATPRLLIFDNCEEEAILKQWRPVSGGCRVLVTSRQGRWRDEMNVRHLPLEVLERNESIALLRRFVPGIAEPDADALAAELGDLPLALHLAGSFLREYELPPTTFLAQLRDQQLLHHPALQGRGTAGSPTNHDLHVGRTLALSFERLEPQDETDEAARFLLACAACFAPGEAFPGDWLLAALESDDKLLPVDGLKRLLALGLLAAEGENGYQLHHLLAVYIGQVLADGMESAQTAVEQAVARKVYDLNMAGYPAALLPWQGQVRHVAERAAERGSEQAATLLNNLGYYLKAIGDYAGAKGPYERALAIWEQALGPDHPTTATSLNNLASLLQEMGDLMAVRPLLERALTIREQVLGLQHPHTATSLNEMARLLQAMGDLAMARPLYERALAIWEQVLGPQHPNTATGLNNLAALLQAMGDLAAARPLYERALVIREQVLGPNHPDTAQSLNNLAALLKDMGDVAAARPLYERALAIWEQALGPNHPTTATSLNNLGYLLQTMGDLAAARPLYERALVIKEQVLGPNHPDTATGLNNLAGLLYAMGDLAAARPLYERALAIDEKALGPHHPGTATDLNNLGSLLQDMGDLAAARPLHERALAIFEKALGPEHPNTRVVRSNLAALDIAYQVAQ